MDMFWQTKNFAEMTTGEWESLCDGCGKCCLVKLEDDDTGEVYYTDVACRYLDSSTARCRDYQQRHHNVPACLNLTPDATFLYDWLPETCAYRLLAQRKPLPDWHPLITGTENSTVLSGRSVAGRVVSEEDIPEDLWQERLIQWVDE